MLVVNKKQVLPADVNCTGDRKSSFRVCIVHVRFWCLSGNVVQQLCMCRLNLEESNPSSLLSKKCWKLGLYTTQLLQARPEAQM